MNYKKIDFLIYKNLTHLFDKLTDSSNVKISVISDYFSKFIEQKVSMKIAYL